VKLLSRSKFLIAYHRPELSGTQINIPSYLFGGKVFVRFWVIGMYHNLPMEIQSEAQQEE
jgi:hypothetical protein